MRILIVDDEPIVRFSLAELLEGDGHEIAVAEHAPAALAILERDSVDLIISDLRLPTIDGLELLRGIQDYHAGTLFVMITAHGDERVAVQALRQGAYDYIPKPFDNQEIRAVVARAGELLALRAENLRLRGELAADFHGLLGTSPAMREVRRTLARAAATSATVLILGESGTGKELAARALHAESARRAKPFIALNCAALPSELVESELFGALRGAFTGAVRERDGVFAAADGGTLFLDELGELALPAQAKLLRAIEQGAVTPLGDTRPRPVDVRLVAATNQPLDELVASGRFRADLLYRLQVITLRLPPLRERREDIEPLARRFLVQLAERHRVRERALSAGASRALLSYDWPGNARELRNALERALVLAEREEIERDDLPPHIAGANRALGPAESAMAGLSFADARARAASEFDRSFLLAALEREGGNITRAARALGIHRQTLQKLMRRVNGRTAPAGAEPPPAADEKRAREQR